LADTVLLKGLYVLIFTDLDTSRVYLTGITARPTGVWVVRQARNLSMLLAERVLPMRFLIRDRYATFTSSFDEVFRTDGFRVIRTPVRAPRANAFAERFVGTVHRECLDLMVIFGRRHLERVLAGYTAHYNGGTARTGLWVNRPRSRPIHHRQQAVPLLRNYAARMPCSVLSTNTGWWSELAGWQFRHPQLDGFADGSIPTPPVDVECSLWPCEVDIASMAGSRPHRLEGRRCVRALCDHLR
jgi:hypothetical protein